MKSRPSYSTEFKIDAAQLVLEQGYTIAEACNAVNVGPTAMRRWVRQLEGEQDGAATPKAKAMTPEHERIQTLEARIKRVEWENDILKKATALFALHGVK